MKNKILRVTALIFAVLIALLLTSCEEQAFPTPTEKFFANDFAEVLTGEDADAIYTAGAALAEATTAQAIVVTVESLEGETIEDYALKIGREWGVGDADKNNGAVILLSVGDREVYVAVGYGLEGALPDSKTGRIIDTYGIPYLSDDNFSAGITNIYNAVVNEIYIEYGLQPSENYIPADLLPEAHSESSAVKILVSWVVLIILVALYVSIFGRKGGMFIFGSPHFFAGGLHSNHGGFGGFRGGGGSFGGGGSGRGF